MKKRNTSNCQQVSVKLLFEEAALKCFSPARARIRKFKSLIEHADSARKTGNLHSFQNQYDNAEELITFYAFAPLILSSNKAPLIDEILRLAEIKEHVDNVVSVGLERLLQPPQGYLAWMQGQVDNHPVKYIREQAQSHKNGNKHLETATHADAFIETENFVILVEMKFTADISVDTTFNPCRNQLARLIDAGIDVANAKGKKLVVFLSTPSGFFETKSRLYVYKIKDYSALGEIQEDISWRTQKQIKEHLLAVKWIPLEDVIKTMYKDFPHRDKNEALTFFAERKLA